MNIIIPRVKEKYKQFPHERSGTFLFFLYILRNRLTRARPFKHLYMILYTL